MTPELAKEMYNDYQEQLYHDLLLFIEDERSKDKENKRRKNVTKKKFVPKFDERKEEIRQEKENTVVVSDPIIVNDEDNKITPELAKEMYNDYQEQLYHDLLLFIEDERSKDKEREMILNNTNDNATKKRLTKIFSLQRAQSSDKIGEYNKMIDTKLEAFQSYLNSKISS